LTIDREKHVATLAGQPVALTPGEFNVLACLAQNAGRVVSAAELAQAAQGYSSAEREARELVKWYVHRLRHKIEPDPAHPQYIRNVRGVGYTFKTI
jgi:two-component system KDP operon response regulator KdpE